MTMLLLTTLPHNRMRGSPLMDRSRATQSGTLLNVLSYLRTRIHPVAALTTAIVLVGGAGVGTAATGGTFILGRSNNATSRTDLTNTEGTPLALFAEDARPPLIVNSGVKVAKLNADRLDGVEAAALQRRVDGECSGGAIREVRTGGGVGCAALPRKVNFAAPIGETTVATFDGVSLNVSCTVVEEFEGPRLYAYLYFTGVGANINGHTTSILYSNVTTVDPIGTSVPTTGTAAKLPTIDASELSYSRQSALVMLTRDGALTQLTLHLLADARQLGPGGKPCTVWGTAI